MHGARSIVAWTLAGVVAAASLSCGGQSGDEKLFAQRRDACQVAAASGETIDQVSAAMGFEPNGRVVQCRTDWVLPPGSPSTCPAGASLCKLFWQQTALDSSLCGSAGGCVYACEGFVPAAQAPDGSDLPGSAPVCAATFVSGQPFEF